jgi:hypothetical protein
VGVPLELTRCRRPDLGGVKQETVAWGMGQGTASAEAIDTKR